MKYLKYFENNKPKKFIIKDVIPNLQKIYSILGLKINDFTINDPFSINIDMDLIKIPYSILYLLIKHKSISSAFPQMTDYLTVKNIKVNYENESKEEFYQKVQKDIINVFENAGFIGSHDVKYTDELKQYIIEFIKNPTVVPKYLIQDIYNNISKKTNSYNILKEIKNAQPFIYNELLNSYPNINDATKMGEMGF